MRRTLSRAQRKARLLRAFSNLTQEELEAKTGVENIGGIESGFRPLFPGQLAQIASFLDLTLDDIEEVLRDGDARRARNRARANERGKEQPPFPPRRAPALEEIVDAYEARFASRRCGMASVRASERAAARESWRTLMPLETFEDMALVVRSAREYQRWSMVELLCHESLRAASKDAGRARILAQAAVEIARRLRVPGGWRRRLLGFALAHLANAHRVAGDHAAADRTFAEAKPLWASGQDPEQLLDPGRILELEASLRRDQRRFGEALDLLKKAAAVTRRPEHVDLQKAFTLEVMGDYSQAIEVLLEVAPRIENHSEARLKTIHRFNLSVLFTHVGRHEEAAKLLPSVRRLAEELGDDLDLIRTRWLAGRVAAGLGQTEEALEALEDARLAFAERAMHYDVVLSLLETAILRLGRGELAEVQRLAGDLAPIFKAKGVHREAHVALRLFSIAAKRQAATAGFARQMLDYLFRARHDETLRFKARAGG
jgi:tetratricopeptide (TPR) repeat protein